MSFRIFVVTVKALLISSALYALCVWLLPPKPALIYVEAVLWYVCFRLLLRGGLQQIAYERGLGVSGGFADSPDGQRQFPSAGLK